MIIGFDIETTPFVEGASPEFKLWTLYNPFYKRHGYTRESLYKEIDYLYRLLDEIEEDIIVVAHNLAFDYSQAIKEVPIEPVEPFKPLMNIMSPPTFAIFPFRKYKGSKKYSLYFNDLLNYVSGKLGDVAESFGVAAKMDSNAIYLPADDPRLLEYCYNDSKICYQVLTKINPFIDGKFKLTAPSMAFAQLKIESGWKYFPRPLFVMIAEREAYYGGRVHVNRHKSIDPNDWNYAYKYDINSMYGFVMRDMKVPVQYIKKLSRNKGDYTDRNIEGYLKAIYESDDKTAIVKAKMRVYRDCLPYRSEDKLYFDAVDGSMDIQGHWSIEELWPAIRDGEADIIYAARIYLYKAVKGLFREYIDKWYGIKQEAGNPDNPDPVKYFWSKLMLNGAYGKFGQKRRESKDPEKIIDPVVLEHLRDKDYFSMDYPVKVVDKYGKESWKVYKVEVASGLITTQETLNIDTRGASCVVASTITALSRRYLWEFLRDYDWLYCDTDSMILKAPDKLHPRHLGDEIGKWKLEPCSAGTPGCEYQFKGRKDYRCRHDIKMKGIMKFDINGKKILTHKSYQEGEFHFWRVLKMKEAMRRNLPPYSLVKTKKERKY